MLPNPAVRRQPEATPEALVVPAATVVIVAHRAQGLATVATVVLVALVAAELAALVAPAETAATASGQAMAETVVMAVTAVTEQGVTAVTAATAAPDMCQADTAMVWAALLALAAQVLLAPEVSVD